MPKLIKTEINGRIYNVCAECGAFVSNPRCLSCTQLSSSDGFLVKELKPYYKGVLPKREPAVLIRHHLLEYFFPSETLVRHNRYENVSDDEILIVRGRDHRRIIRGYRLHQAEMADERLLDSDSGVKELLSRIPIEVIGIFSVKE